jgi:hypothetical protein
MTTFDRERSIFVQPMLKSAAMEVSAQTMLERRLIG